MITVSKVLDTAAREQALQVVERVYRQEKNWIKSVEQEIPADIGFQDRTSWFLAKVNGHPGGVLRLLYDPPLELPPECQATFKKGFDPQQLIDLGKFVEIGRFLILPEYRKKIFVTLRLMGAAVQGGGGEKLHPLHHRCLRGGDPVPPEISHPHPGI